MVCVARQILLGVSSAKNIVGSGYQGQVRSRRAWRIGRLGRADSLLREGGQVGLGSGSCCQIANHTWACSLGESGVAGVLGEGVGGVITVVCVLLGRGVVGRMKGFVFFGGHR